MSQPYDTEMSSSVLVGHNIHHRYLYPIFILFFFRSYSQNSTNFIHNMDLFRGRNQYLDSDQDHCVVSTEITLTFRGKYCCKLIDHEYQLGLKLMILNIIWRLAFWFLYALDPYFTRQKKKIITIMKKYVFIGIYIGYRTYLDQFFYIFCKSQYYF